MDSKLMEKIDLEEFQGATKAVAEHYNISEEEAEKYIMTWGPKALKRTGILDAGSSWREGYTKPTMEKRKSQRRKKNKMARKARKANR